MGIESVVAQLVCAVVRQPRGQTTAEKVRADTALEVENVANLRVAVLLFDWKSNVAVVAACKVFVSFKKTVVPRRISCAHMPKPVLLSAPS